jgi:MFS family permease
VRTSTPPAWLVRVLAGVVLTQAALYMARPVTSYRALALGADARAVGLITAAFALVPLVVAVPLGRASDRWRPGWLLTGRIALGAVACALLGRAGRPRATAEGRPLRAGELIGARGVPAGMFASLAILATVDVLTAYLPVLGTQRGIAPAVVGALLSLRAATSILSRVLIPWMVGRLGRIRLLAASAAASALVTAALPLAGGPVVLGVLLAGAGFLLGIGQPLTMSMVVHAVPADTRGTALAIRLTGNRFGQVATPAAAGLVAGAAGVSAAFWLLGGPLGLAALAVTRR